MTNLQAYAALPALRASLEEYKRDLVQRLQGDLDAATSPLRRDFYRERLRRVEAMKPPELRNWYLSQRVGEISRGGVGELFRVCRGRFVRL